MEWILNRNIMIGAVVLCIVAARTIFIYRIPGNTWLLLWKILILQLLCPFKLELRLRNINVNKNVVNILPLQDKMRLSDQNVLLSSADEIIKIIWLIGAIVIAGIFIGSHLVRRRLYCMALPVKGIYFEEWKESHFLRRKVKIKESDRVAIPLTYGVIRPVILLPAHRDIEERHLAFMLEHEFIHIRHMDVLLKWILVFICSIYWYNPLIWVMYFFVNRDVELSCDEFLLRHQNSGYKKEYLSALVNLEEKKAERGVLCSSFCKYPIEERIKVMVKTGKEPSRRILLSMLIVCLITILSIGTMARAETAYSYDKIKLDVTGRNEVLGGIPNIIGYDEGKTREVLEKQGFSYIIK